MRIYGEYIGKLQCNVGGTAVMNRVLEIYATKTIIKFFLFNSGNIAWHRKSCLIYTKNILKGRNPEKRLLAHIEDISKEYKLELSGVFMYQDKQFTFARGKFLK
jgi:hypothetical protein